MGPRIVRYLLAFLALLLMGVESSAQQLTYVQDLAFQTITPTPANAGFFSLYPYGAAHFVLRENEILNPADFTVYDSLGQPTGQHFRFHPALDSAHPQRFFASANGHAYIAGTYADTSQLPPGQRLIAVAKFLPNGDPDSSWGQQGIWYGDPTLDLNDGVRKLQVLPSGAVMLIDQPIVAGTNSAHYYLRRLTPTGQLDTAFGNQGSTLINPDGRPATAFYLAESGSAYACVNYGDPVDVRMARWLANGQADTTFTIPGSLRSIMNVLPDGRIISERYTAGLGWHLRRHWSNGSVDTGHVALPVNIGCHDCPLTGGGRLFLPDDYDVVSPPFTATFSVILPDGTHDPAYMPAGLPLVFQMPVNFWPPNYCHPTAIPSIGDLIAIGPRRIIYVDYLNAQVINPANPNEYENIICPRIISLVTDLQTVGQPAPGESATLSCSPNPVADHFSLRIPTRARSAQVQLYDLAGKSLALPEAAVSVVEGALQLDYQDLGGLPSGLYLLRVAAGGQQFTAKLLKE
jgi:hypothetical protein